MNGLKDYLRTTALRYIFSLENISLKEAGEIADILVDRFWETKTCSGFLAIMDSFKDYLIENYRAVLVDWLEML